MRRTPRTRAVEETRMLRTLTGAALVVTLLSIGAAAQNASSVVAAASKAMGVDTLNSITYSGTARNGAFGQSKAIGAPLGAGQHHANHHVHAHHQLRAAQPIEPRSSRARRVRRNRRRCRAYPRRCRASSIRTSPGAGRHELEPGAEHLDHAVGIPEGRGGQQRHGPRSRGGSRSCRSRRPTSSRRRDSRTR